MVFVNPHWSLGSLADDGLLADDGSLATTDNQQLTTDTEQPTILDQFTLAIKKALEKLGLIIQNGIAKVKELVADVGRFNNLEVENKIQLRDQATGELYCTWIENGGWVKVKAECENK